MIVRARRMRTTEDMDAIVMAARLRSDRRLRAVRARGGYFPNPEDLDLLDRATESIGLINRLEERREDIADAWAERAWEANYADR